METTQKPKEIIGHLMVLSTIVIYSFNTNFMKILMPEWIGPHGLVLIRCTVMAFGFWIISLFIPANKQQAKPKRKDILMMMLGGLLGIGGNLLLYINGLNITGPVDAFVIRTVQPIIVIALAVLILHADFNRYKAIGIVLGLAGTLYVSITPHAGAVKDSFTGDVLIFVASVFNALYLILIKPYTQKFNSVIVMRWMSLAAFILVLPFGLHQTLEAPLFTSEAPVHIWLELGFVLIFATMIAYFLNLKALLYISPFVESVYIYLLPITGAIVSISLGLQKFSWHDPIALVLIIAGFALINKKKKVKAVINYKNTFILSDKSAIIPLCFFRNSHIFILDSGFCNISGDSSIKVTTFSNSFVSLTLVANICMKNTLFSLSSNKISSSLRNSSPSIFANLTSLIIVLSF